MKDIDNLSLIARRLQDEVDLVDISVGELYEQIAKFNDIIEKILREQK